MSKNKILLKPEMIGTWWQTTNRDPVRITDYKAPYYELDNRWLVSNRGKNKTEHGPSLAEPLNTRILKLEIISWAGTVGLHYYGRIKQGYQKLLDVQQKLTRKLTKQLNNEDPTYKRKIGNYTNQFHTELEVETAAIELIKKEFPTSILTKGCDLNPGRILYHPPTCTIAPRLIELANLAESWYKTTNDPWRTFGDNTVNPVFDEWSKLVEQWQSK